MILYSSRQELLIKRKCRNWQTSKTKDLVTIAVVWVQVPSSAFFMQEWRNWQTRTVQVRVNIAFMRVQVPFPALRIRRKTYKVLRLFVFCFFESYPQPSRDAERIFMQFRERYDIVKLLGRGTTASVYFVRDRHLDTHWAVKMFDTSQFEKRDWLCLENEICILKQIQSLWMPRIVDLYRESGRVCIVMDYIDGVRLDRYIHTYGPVGETLAIQWMIELCEIIQQLHQMTPAVVYCDLKPENIIIQKTGHLALIDLGSARQIQEDIEYEEVMPLTGTPGYTAPELIPKPLADIYSIGAIGRYLLTGLHKMDNKMLVGQGSKELIHILDECLETPDKRIPTCCQLKEKMQRLL